MAKTVNTPTKEVDWSTVNIICDDCMRKVDGVRRIGDKSKHSPWVTLEIRCHGKVLLRVPAFSMLTLDEVRRTILLSGLGEADDAKILENGLRFMSGTHLEELACAALALGVVDIQLSDRDVALMYSAMVGQGVPAGEFSPDALESASIRLMELFQLVHESQLSRKDTVDQPG